MPGAARGQEGSSSPGASRLGKRGDPRAAVPCHPRDSQVLGFRMLLVMGGPGGADMEKSERQSSSWEQPAWMARR